MRILLAMAIVALAGCASSVDQPADRARAPGTPDESRERLSRAANPFTFALFKQQNLAQPASNVFVSPLGVSVALAMAMNGASGTTFDEMRSTLAFGDAALAEINQGYRSLLSLTSSLDRRVTFQIANSLWYRQGLPLDPAFVDRVRQTFEAEVQPSPFDRSTADRVNEWVSAKTNARIPKILDRIDDRLVMFLINAIYFKGPWREAFDPAQTRDAPFAAADGTQQVKMMNRRAGSGTIRFGRTANATLGELPYGNGAFVMTLIIPDADVTAFASTLDAASWQSLVAEMREAQFQVALPRFRLEYERELSADLKALGMNVPFVEGRADFTRMSPAGRELFISFVRHKSFVDVNEEGTEAAAATSVGIGVTSLPPCLCVDKPFILAIREQSSGTILFIGKVVRIP